MGTIWRHASVDIETFSDVDIAKAGLYKYAQSPAFEVLLIAWAVDDGPVQIVDLTTDPGANGSGTEWIKLQEFLTVLHDPYTILHAYNAAFEHECLNVWLERQGALPIPLERWRCTMAAGLYCGYPAGLAAIGEAMGLPQDKKKLGIGAALIRRFCVPQKEKPLPLLGELPRETTLEKVRRWAQLEPAKWDLFKTYCKQDVETEREIGRRLSPWPMPETEQVLWELTTKANAVGVGVDRELVDAAIAIGEAEQQRMMQEARELSGLDNPKSVSQLMKWLDKELPDPELTDLRKATVADLLKTGVDNKKAERMLQLRQQMSKTSTKKYDAIQAAVCDDGRVRGMMFYYGAPRSGRWAGRIVQPQNLPQNHLPNLDYARQLVKARDAELLELSYGSVPDALSQLIRTAFVPRSGHRFAVADYSAIEARVVAWLAGETWVLDAFRRGEDIYCATASQMFGVPVEKHGQNAHLRQRGKVAVLALGYGGGESALTAMGALKMGILEEDLKPIKESWRRANANIVQFWKRVEDAAIAAVMANETTKVTIGGGGRLVFRRESDTSSGADAPPSPQGEGSEGRQDFLTITLPSGRALFYAHPTLKPARNFPERRSLHYMSLNQTTRKWDWTDTWGGKLVENITQAVARDCLANTLIELWNRNMIAVFHVHDEVIVEITSDDQLDEILAVMAAPISWAPGLPLKGAGFTCGYYQKD